MVARREEKWREDEEECGAPFKIVPLNGPLVVNDAHKPTLPLYSSPPRKRKQKKKKKKKKKNTKIEILNEDKGERKDKEEGGSATAALAADDNDINNNNEEEEEEDDDEEERDEPKPLSKRRREYFRHRHQVRERIREILRGQYSDGGTYKTTPGLCLPKWAELMGGVDGENTGVRGGEPWGAIARDSKAAMVEREGKKEKGEEKKGQKKKKDGKKSRGKGGGGGDGGRGKGTDKKNTSGIATTTTTTTTTSSPSPPPGGWASFDGLLMCQGLIVSGNGGESGLGGFGVVLAAMDGTMLCHDGFPILEEEVVRENVSLGEATYAALMHGLVKATRSGMKRLMVLSDAFLTAQMRGETEPRQGLDVTLREDAIHMMSVLFSRVEFHAVTPGKNGMADLLAKQGVLQAIRRYEEAVEEEQALRKELPRS